MGAAVALGAGERWGHRGDPRVSSGGARSPLPRLTLLGTALTPSDPLCPTPPRFTPVFFQFSPFSPLFAPFRPGFIPNLSQIHPVSPRSSPIPTLFLFLGHFSSILPHFTPLPSHFTPFLSILGKFFFCFLNFHPLPAHFAHISPQPSPNSDPVFPSFSHLLLPPGAGPGLGGRGGGGAALAALGGSQPLCFGDKNGTKFGSDFDPLSVLGSPPEQRASAGRVLGSHPPR